MELSVEEMKAAVKRHYGNGYWNPISRSILVHKVGDMISSVSEEELPEPEAWADAYAKLPAPQQGQTEPLDDVELGSEKHTPPLGKEGASTQKAPSGRDGGSLIASVPPNEDRECEDYSVDDKDDEDILDDISCEHCEDTGTITTLVPCPHCDLNPDPPSVKPQTEPQPDNTVEWGSHKVKFPFRSVVQEGESEGKLRPLTEAEKDSLKPFMETRQAQIALHYGSYHDMQVALQSQIDICNELRERLREAEIRLVPAKPQTEPQGGESEPDTFDAIDRAMEIEMLQPRCPNCNAPIGPPAKPQDEPKRPEKMVRFQNRETHSFYPVTRTEAYMDYLEGRVRDLEAQIKLTQDRWDNAAREMDRQVARANHE